MRILLTPEKFDCPQHPQHSLTESVLAAIDTGPVKLVRFGFRTRRTGQAPVQTSRPFRVVVECPEGAGHPVTCAGDWRRG